MSLGPAVFPLEVGQRPRGDSATALAQGLSALNEGLFAGNACLRDALTAEVKARSDIDAKKALARDVHAQAHGARGGAPARRLSPGGISPPPTAVAGGIQGL